MLFDKSFEFNEKLVIQCANCFADSTGLGCQVSTVNGKIIFEKGMCCTQCEICKVANVDPAECTRSKMYGTNAASRFGGRYIFCCPMGLTMFVSPIVGDTGNSAKILAGPFLMVEPEDFFEFEMRTVHKFDNYDYDDIADKLARIPYVSPDKVESFSTLLFFAVGFLNDLSAANTMLKAQESDDIHGVISSYIQQVKDGMDFQKYPFELEKELLECVSADDREKLKNILADLLGRLIVICDYNIDSLKSRICEMLVLISRTAINAGADVQECFYINNKAFVQMNKIKSTSEICPWLLKTTLQFMDSILSGDKMKHYYIIRKAISYIKHHYTEKITMADVARHVYLSPTYFSKIFNQEMGQSFSTYLNNIRVEKAKTLLLNNELKLIQVSFMLGFEDQSYFSKMFKKEVGIAPLDYKKRAGTRAKQA